MSGGTVASALVPLLLTAGGHPAKGPPALSSVIGAAASALRVAPAGLRLTEGFGVRRAPARS